MLRPLAEAELHQGAGALARTLGDPSRPTARRAVRSLAHPAHRPGGHPEAGADRGAEKALRAVGVEDSRVRHHGDIARIEVAPTDLPRLIEDDVRAEVVRAVKAAGFATTSRWIWSGTYQSGAFTLQVLTRRG